MAEVTMPRLSDTMEEGTIAAWLKQPGEQVSKGEVIAQIETDKATMDLTAFEAGTLQEILAPEGATVQIGQPVARIGSGDATPKQEKRSPSPEPEPEASEPAVEKEGAGREETASEPEASEPAVEEEAAGRAETASEPEASDPTAAVADEAAAKEAEAAVKEVVAAAPEASAQEPEPQEESADGRAEADGKVRASPMARHMAAEHGLDLGAIEGTGPQGRVIRADIEAALASAPPTAEAPSAPAQAKAATAAGGDERVQLSQMRRTIARRMAESTRTVPHFFLTIGVDATELVLLRKQVVEQLADDGVKVSINDLVVKAAALALKKVPDVNVSFADDSLIRHAHVNVGIAVGTERGLIVPVVRDADQKTLTQIARETRDLAERARSGKLQPPDYSGGTFSISNLGMFGIEQFNAVINPPEAAILAVGAITRAPADYQGQVALRDRMQLTLSVDHRALDGAMGARYLQALKALLEKPLLLLV